MLELRPLHIADAAALAELLAAAERVDRTEAHLDADDVAHRLADPNVNLREHAIAALVDGELVGYGMLRARRVTGGHYTVRGDGAVHPRWRRRGFGRRILRWLTDRAAVVAAAERPELSGALHVFCHQANPGKLAMLSEAGYTPGPGWLDMQRPLTGPLPDLGVPAGLRIVDYTAALDEPVRLLHNEAFADHWGSPPADRASWRQSYTGTRAFRPELSVVALAGEHVVGYLLGYEWTAVTAATGRREAWLGQAGTAAAWRGRRTATALLGQAMLRAARLGYQQAGLRVHTNNPNRARQLELVAGFAPTHRWISYLHPLSMQYGHRSA